MSITARNYYTAMDQGPARTIQILLEALWINLSGPVLSFSVMMLDRSGRKKIFRSGLHWGSSQRSAKPMGARCPLPLPAFCPYLHCLEAPLLIAYLDDVIASGSDVGGKATQRVRQRLLRFHYTVHTKYRYVTC